jgi:DNA replication protein DnaC
MVMASGEFEHDESRCAAGKCAHAVSERVPCKCETCDATTRELVSGYAREAMISAAETGSASTPRFRERTFDRFIQSAENGAAYFAARKVAKDPSKGLGIYGPVGIGKSHLAAAIANECTANGIVAIYVGVDEMLGRIKATFDGKTGETESALIAKYAKAAVLVIDDIGKEALTDWSVRTMFSLINRRYENNLPLIVTSNFSPVQFASRKVGKDAEPMTYASTCDRIAEMTGAWVGITGESRR